MHNDIELYRDGVMFSMQVDAFLQNDMSECTPTVEVYDGKDSIALAVINGETAICCDLPPAIARALAAALLEGRAHVPE